HIQNHAQHTRSATATQLLKNWDTTLSHFVKLYPKDYKRMLERIAEAKTQGHPDDTAIMAAFEANAKDTSRVGGN
ncbi:MAG: hypothetical protein LBD01_01900, partial [Puniceicoccales bacterium]|nr:hypothetical protein [Puniceicoccales bacterium]